MIDIHIYRYTRIRVYNIRVDEHVLHRISFKRIPTEIISVQCSIEWYLIGSFSVNVDWGWWRWNETLL